MMIYRLQGVEFEWDEAKAQSNRKKHRVSFEEAAEVFFDPFYIIEEDDSSVDEQRSCIIGCSQSPRLLFVVHVERRPRIRIISARLATRTERELYEDA